LSNKFQISLSDNTIINAKIHYNRCSKWLVCLHGLGEHLDYHSYINDYLGSSYNILQFDLRGHGKSEGPRGWIENFWQFSLDLQEVLDWLTRNWTANDISFFAHSMGSVILCDFFQNLLGPFKKFNKVFLSSPAVGFSGLGKLFQYSPNAITGLISELPWDFHVGGSEDYTRYSHNPNVLTKKKDDPLFLDTVSSKLIAEIAHASNRIFERPLNLGADIYIVMGGSDPVICPMTAIEYFSNIEKAREVLIIPGGYHELYEEIPKYKAPFLKFLEQSLITKNCPKSIRSITV